MTDIHRRTTFVGRVGHSNFGLRWPANLGHWKTQGRSRLPKNRGRGESIH